MRRKLKLFITTIMLLLVGLISAACTNGLATTTVTTVTITTTSAITTTNQPGIPQAAGKPQPIDRTFQGCPPSGDGGDPVLNTLKNRIDEGQWQPAIVASILALTWPKSIEQQPRAKWSPQDQAAIAQYEGTPLQVEGYLALARKESPESVNCHSVKLLDYHIWLVDDPTKARDQSVVVEATPRVLAVHPAWTITRISQIASSKTRVRISGWLMMDPEHPDQIAKTRGTIWEIHPIMQIETLEGNSWRPLDNGSTGVGSAPAQAQIMPPVTPVATATQPLVGNSNVQQNDSVQITNIFYNGVKGSQEPDEYVEIKNNGAQPVDITDWTLQDSSAQNVFKWESFTLPPGNTIRVYTNEVNPESGGFSFNSGRAIWGNSGDVATLYDSDKELVSRYVYGNKK